MPRNPTLAVALAATLALLPAAADAQQKVLRIGMTAADVPTTTGMPNNGFEGSRKIRGVTVVRSWSRNTATCLCQAYPAPTRLSPPGWRSFGRSPQDS